MAVRIGSARVDENGHATGGKPGDQTGKEVSTQNWYLHSKGWRVFRPLEAAAAEKIAYAMQAACDNPKIGYDQSDRLTLYYAARDYGFDPAKVKTNVETDCSALVRVCCAHAGIKLPNFTTPGEPKVLLESHAFMELVGDKYQKASGYLKRGDVLVTPVQGHTVVVLTDGERAEETPVIPSYALGDRLLRNGSGGTDVKELQNALIELGYDCGAWGADGDFGDATEIAVKAFQARSALEEDGIVGPKTVAALRKALSDMAASGTQHVVIVGGNCYVRTGPGTEHSTLGVALIGSSLEYRGEESPTGWLAVVYRDKNGWVSGKYGRLMA